jgi:hypothetical protein
MILPESAAAGLSGSFPADVSRPAKQIEFDASAFSW